MTNQNIQLKKSLFKLPNGTYVAPYTDNKGALEVGDIGQSLTVNEAEGLRRVLNGQAVPINANTQAFLDKLKSIKTTAPSLFCNEDEWQNIKASNLLGQCGKFVIQESSTLIREQYNIRFKGTLNRSHGVVRGFYNNANALIAQETIPWQTANSIVIVLKINVENPSADYNALMGNDTDSFPSGGIVLRTNTSGNPRLKLWATTNCSAWTTAGVDTGIDLSGGVQYIKLTYDGNTIVMSKSLDGTTYTNGIVITTGKIADCAQWFGATGSGGSFYLRGSIDLSESSIYVNGSLWNKPFELVSETVEPYIRIPRIVNLQGNLDINKLGTITTVKNRTLVAQRKPTLDDTRWYNWYSDGWLEQGGYVLQNNATNAAWTSYQIIMLKPYRDTMYNVNTQTGHTSETSAPSLWSMDAQSFYMRPYNSSGDAQWTARGWGNKPTLSDYNITDIEHGDVQFPYFIQIAQGQTTMTTIRNNWEITNPYTIFDAKQSQYPLNNLSWVCSKGQWNPKSMYTYAYEALLVELNNSIETNTTVTLPSGGKYTKHLQTVNFDATKVIKVGNPIIEEGILKPITTDYVRLLVGENTFNTAKEWNLELKVKNENDRFIINTNNADGITSFALSNKQLVVNNIAVINYTVPVPTNNWYFIRVNYKDSTGYTVSYSTNGVDYTALGTNATVDKVAFAQGVMNMMNVQVDLRTVIFTYNINGMYTNTVTAGTIYKAAVWNKAEHATTEADYGYTFIVDTVNETFRLPLYDRVYNNPYSDLYFYLGDVAQNTSLIDIGRISSSVTDIYGQVNELRDLIGRISGNIPTVEPSTYGTKHVTLYNGTDLGDHSIDLSSFIPLDGHSYDIHGYMIYKVGDTSANNRNAYIYNADKTQVLTHLSVDGVAQANDGDSTMSFTAPLPNNSRTILLELSGTSNFKFSEFKLYLEWFRKY